MPRVMASREPKGLTFGNDSNRLPDNTVVSQIESAFLLRKGTFSLSAKRSSFQPRSRAWNPCWRAWHTQSSSTTTTRPRCA